MEPGTPPVWPEFGSNVAFEVARGERHHTEEAFASAARVSRIAVVNNRVIANYMETRGVIAEYDAAKRPLHAHHGHPGRSRHA